MMLLFGSQIIAAHLATTLGADADITATVGTRIHDLPRAPQGSVFPVLLYQAEIAVPNGEIGTDTAQHVDFVEGRNHVRIIVKGGSTRPILDAALRQGELLLNGEGHTFTYDDQPYFITYRTNSQLLPTTLFEGVDQYRQLGTVYNFTLSRGG